MKDLRADALRYPSAAAVFLRLLGAVVVVIGILQALSPVGDLVGLATITGGLIVFGLGSLRKALGDIIFELRDAADRRTSEHPSNSERSTSRSVD